jgi:protein-tyrosine phosphatase
MGCLADLGSQAVIDLHCHILPGLDDGAGNLSVSLQMAKAAAEPPHHTAPPHLFSR